jgi:transcriptional regulator with XRE-family HTH domain
MREQSIGIFLKERRLRIDRNTTVLGKHARFPDRVGRPVSQEEIAEALDVSRQWYATLESGTARTSTVLLQRMSDLFCLNSWERLELIRLAIPEFATLIPAQSAIFAATNLQLT